MSDNVLFGWYKVVEWHLLKQIFLFLWGGSVRKVFRKYFFEKKRKRRKEENLGKEEGEKGGVERGCQSEAPTIWKEIKIILHSRLMSINVYKKK